MAKEKKEKSDINGIFSVGDLIRHKKNGIQGKIAKFEWSGIDRAALIPSGKSNGGWYIYTLKEIELITPSIDAQPEPIK